jgi:hypothetical protein
VKGILGPFAFALSLLATAVCTVLVEATLGAFRPSENAEGPDDLSRNALERWLDEVLPPAFGTQNDEKLALRVISHSIGVIPLICGLARVVDQTVGDFAGKARMFAVSFTACILSYSATMMNSAVLGLFALALSAASLTFSAIMLMKKESISGNEVPMVSILFGGTAFIVSLAAIWMD